MTGGAAALADRPVPEIEVLHAAARTLLEALERKGTVLVTAESCTGGFLASLVTDIEGLSHGFERGFVTYTKDAKRELLGVDGELLEREGAVSEPVARAMAEGGWHGRAAGLRWPSPALPVRPIPRRTKGPASPTWPRRSRVAPWSCASITVSGPAATCAIWSVLRRWRSGSGRWISNPLARV